MLSALPTETLFLVAAHLHPHDVRKCLAPVSSAIWRLLGASHVSLAFASLHLSGWMPSARLAAAQPRALSAALQALQLKWQHLGSSYIAAFILRFGLSEDIITAVGAPFLETGYNAVWSLGVSVIGSAHSVFASESVSRAARTGALDLACSDYLIFRWTARHGDSSLFEILLNSYQTATLHLRHHTILKDPTSASVATASLIIASEFGHVDIVRLLFKHAYQDFDITFENSSPFRLACANGHSDVLDLLLTHPDIDPSAQSNHAIRVASQRGFTRIVKRLLESKDVNPADLESDALRYASIRGHDQVVALLVADGRSDVTARDYEALRFAISKGYLNVVTLLLESGQVDVSWRDFFLLRMVLEKGSADMMRQMLMYLDSVAGLSDILQKAMDLGQKDIVQILLEKLMRTHVIKSIHIP